MRKRTEIKFTEQERELIEQVAGYLQYTITETVRRSLRFGLNALLKFEKNGKMDLKKLEASSSPVNDQENNSTKQEEGLAKAIEIANTKWLDED